MGGFHLRKWVSNSPHVMMSIPEEERSGSIKDLNFDQPTIERALGSHWDVIKDEFVFKVTIKPKQPTRRGLLSIVSSIYDPLGFTAPFILPAKILLQELCKDGLKWDDLIEPSHLQRWNNWLQELPKLEQLHLPRSMKPDHGTMPTPILLSCIPSLMRRKAVTVQSVISDSVTSRATLIALLSW